MELDPMVISMHTHSLRLTHSVCEPHSAQISYIISCYFIHAIRKYIFLWVSFSVQFYYCECGGAAAVDVAVVFVVILVVVVASIVVVVVVAFQSMVCLVHFILYFFFRHLLASSFLVSFVFTFMPVILYKQHSKNPYTL